MGAQLSQVLDLQNLSEAWNEVADNKGVAGADHITIQRWNRNWEERLVQLARDVRCNTYRPYGARQIRIPKRKPNEYRVLRIPTVTDRVLQRAVTQILQPIYEPIFLECSFGYRPGRGLRDAVQQILDLRQQGLHWVLDADIDAFFDAVDHELLLRLLEEEIQDNELLHLIGLWLEKWCVCENKSVGIAMGSPVSPILANIYLHQLDWGLINRGRRLVRYADDFIVLTEDPAELNAIYRETDELLSSLQLVFEPEKTGFANFHEGFDYLGVHFLENSYSYHYQEKEVKVKGKKADRLFNDYGPHY